MNRSVLAIVYRTSLSTGSPSRRPFQAERSALGLPWGKYGTTRRIIGSNSEGTTTPAGRSTRSVLELRR